MTDHVWRLDGGSPQGSQVMRCTRCGVPFVWNVRQHQTQDEALAAATLPPCKSVAAIQQEAPRPAPLLALSS